MKEKQIISPDLEHIFDEKIIDSAFYTPLQYIKEYEKKVPGWSRKEQLLHLMDCVCLDEEDLEEGLTPVKPLSEIAREFSTRDNPYGDFYAYSSSFLCLLTERNLYVLFTSPLFGSEHSNDIEEISFLELDNPCRLDRYTIINIYAHNPERFEDIKRNGIIEVIKEKSNLCGDSIHQIRQDSRYNKGLDYLFNEIE